jgi:hypothetical protein
MNSDVEIRVPCSVYGPDEEWMKNFGRYSEKKNPI